MALYLGMRVDIWLKWNQKGIEKKIVSRIGTGVMKYIFMKKSLSLDVLLLSEIIEWDKIKIEKDKFRRMVKAEE